MLKQCCLEGILAKESSLRTKDFLLCRDLHSGKTLISAAILTKNQPFTCPFTVDYFTPNTLMFLDILFELSKTQKSLLGWGGGGLTSLCLILSK